AAPRSPRPAPPARAGRRASRQRLVVRARERSRVVALRRAVVTGDEEHDPVGRALAARLLGTEARVIEVPRERRVPAGELAPHPRREPREDDARDAMPQLRARGLRDVVQQAGRHELLVGTLRPQDLRGPLGVADVGARDRRDDPERLPRAPDHQNSRVPTSRFASDCAGPNTTWNRIRPPKNSSARSSIGPYCWYWRHVNCWRGGRSPYTTFEPSSGGIGTRLKMPRTQLKYTTNARISVYAPPNGSAGPKRRELAQTAAIANFAAGPASATSATELELRRRDSLNGTGFP